MMLCDGSDAAIIPIGGGDPYKPIMRIKYVKEVSLTTITHIGSMII